MHNLQLVDMTLSEFKTYREPTTFHLAPSPGLHFLRGDNRDASRLESNGSGKSSVWDGFCWIVKGQTLPERSRQAGLRGPDLQPWEGGSPDGKLRLRLNGRPYSVHRTVAPNSLQLDGRDVAQDRIDELFGNLSLAAIGNTIIHGQGRDLFFDLAPRDKMELLSDVLDLGRWERGSVIASRRVAQINSEIARMEAQVVAANGALAEIDTQIELGLQAQAGWSNELRQELARLDRQVAEDQQSLERIANRWGEANLVNDSAGTQAKLLERVMAQSEELHDGANVNLLAKSEACQTNNRARRALEQRIDRIQADDVCPTCGQMVNGRHLRTELKRQLKELEATGAVLDGELKVLRNIEQDLRDQLDEVRESFRQFRERERQTQTTLNVLGPEKTRLETRIRVAEAERQHKREAANPYGEQLKVQRRRRAELLQLQKAVAAKIKRFRIQAERAAFWIKGCKEVRLDLIKQSLAQMQLLANSILEESGLVGWSLQYVTEQLTKSDTTKVGLAVLVKPRHSNKSIRWESFSGGERQRLRLVGTSALSEVLLNNAGMTVNLQVFDEPTIGLSPRGIEDMIDLLADQARWSNRSIWLVDQHVIESAKFASVVTVRRDVSWGSYLVD